MEFKTQLNHYLDILGCSGQALSEASGLSPSVISRYRSGSRTPAANSDALEKLVQGLVALSQSNSTPLDIVGIRAALSTSCISQGASGPALAGRLDRLITDLAINTNDLARAMSYDPSYISLIRRGKRVPRDLPAFSQAVARYVTLHHQDPPSLTNLALTLEQQDYPGLEEGAREAALTHWLSQQEILSQTDAAEFLHTIDNFDLEATLTAMHFDTMKVPSVPFLLPTAKTYPGLAGMRQGEVDFLKAVVLGKSKGDVIMGSDMPMDDLTEGSDLFKKYAFGIAMVLKKGNHIHFIHNVNRPLSEMLTGLSGWVPLYMTGQISPYYLPGPKQAIYGHLLYSAEGCAIAGECIAGYHDEGRYFLSKRKEDVDYYRRRSKRLLAKAKPLMTILSRGQADALHTFLQADANIPGMRQGLLTAPPLFTLPLEDLKALLAAQDVPEAMGRDLCAQAQIHRQTVETILKTSTIAHCITRLSTEEFKAEPARLALADTFCEKDLPYTPALYQKHFQATQAFAETHPSFTYTTTAEGAFKNIQIRIHHGHWAMVSKSRSPAIHFIIRHPRMIEALSALLQIE